MMTNDEFRERLRKIEKVDYMLTRLLEWSIFLGVAGTYDFDYRMGEMEKMLDRVEFSKKKK